MIATPLAARPDVGSSGVQQRSIRLLISGLGFTAAIVQLALSRELLVAMAGNELTVGITLSCWLILTAIGTWFGSFKRSAIARLPLLALGVGGAAVLAVAELLLFRLVGHAVFSPGATLDPVTVACTCLVVLAPFCLVSGALLTAASHALAHANNSAAIGQIYGADAIGGVVGALVFTFVFSTSMDESRALFWTAAVIWGLVAAVFADGGERRGILPSLLIALCLAIGGSSGIDARSTQWSHHAPVIYRATSPYGRLVVTQAAGQATCFENGNPIAFSHDMIQAEELVHATLLQRPNLHSVLIIGGLLTHAPQVALQYPNVDDVTVMEIDPSLVAAANALIPKRSADRREHVILGDGRRYLQRTPKRFDAVIVMLPDPLSYQLNRFFTAEFFSMAKRALTPDGIVAFGCGHYENYISRELRGLIASNRTTLGATFAHVTVIPGSRMFFLGSDAPLTRDLAAAIEQRHIDSPLVNRHYLDATLAEDRLADVDDAAASAAPLNRDSRPVLYGLVLRRWLAQFAFPAATFGCALALSIAVFVARLRPAPRLLFAAGFAGSSLELVLVLAVQSLYGCLYQQIGIVVGTFLLGLAVGSVSANPLAPTAGLAAVRHLGGGVAAVAAGVAVLLPMLPRMDGLIVHGTSLALILAATLLLAGTMGAQFSLASTGPPSASAGTAARVFSADLVGAAVGGLATSAILLPILGAVGACLLTSGLNAVAVGLSFGRRRPS